MKSIFQILGIPEGISIPVTLITTAFCISPYFSNLDFGILKIPDIQNAAKKRIKFLSPVVLGLLIICYIPIRGGVDKLKSDSLSEIIEPNDSICSAIRSKIKQSQTSLEQKLLGADKDQIANSDLIIDLAYYKNELTKKHAKSCQDLIGDTTNIYLLLIDVNKITK
jgi:hypothetical protein